MRDFGLIAAAVIVGGFLLAWPLHRVSQRVGAAVSLLAHVAARVAVIVIAGWVGVRAVEQGTVLYVALAVLLFLVVAAAVVMSGIYVVALVATFRDSDSTGT